MQTFRRSTDEVIFAFAAFFFLLSLFLLLDESIIFKIGKRHYSDLQEVAVMSKKHNDVRRRVATDITWFPAFSSDALYFGDNIFTGPGSEATILFKEGSDLVLAEETLVVLEKSTEKTILNLKWGMLSGHVGKGKPLTVKIGNKTKTIQSNGAEIQINRNKDGGFELAVQKGSVEVTGEKGEKKQKIVTGQALRSDEKEDSVIQRVKYQIELLTPNQNSIHWKDFGSKINFSWKKTKESKNYILAIAKDREFNKIVYYKKSELPQMEVSDLPPMGQLYWKVIDLQNRQTSQAKRFSLYSGEPPFPVAPAQNKSVVFGPDFKRKQDVKYGEYPVWMQWSYKNSFEKFEVEISKDKKFEQIVKNQLSSSWQEKIDLPEGHFYWRVRVKDDRRPTAAWSASNKLTVQRVLPAPKIKEKVKKKRIDKEIKEGASYWLRKLWEMILPSARAEDAVEEGMQLNWEKISDASSYEITIARDKDLKEVVEKKTLKTNGYLWNEKLPGIYYWRVRAVNAMGELQEPSEVGKVLLTVSSPKIKSEILELTVPLTEEDKPHPATLEWKPVYKIENYLVETSDTKDFKRIKEYVVKNETSLKVLANKTLFWRVTPLDSKEQPIGEKTTRALVQVNFKSPSLFGFFPQIIKGKYTEPLHFDMEPNEVQIKFPEIEYDVKDYGLSLGQKQINPSMIRMQLINHSQSKVTVNYLLPPDQLGTGLIELEGEDHKILETTAFNPKKGDLKYDDSGLFLVEGPSLSEKQLQKISEQTELKVCVRQRWVTAKVSTCSPAVKIENSEGEWILQTLKQNGNLKVKLDNQEVSSKGSIIASSAESKELSVEFPDHSSVELQAIPPQTQYDEVFLSNEDDIVISGFGDRPYNLPKTAVITAKDKPWFVRLPPSQKAIHIASSNGLIWKQELIINRALPQEIDRPHLLMGTKKSTYQNELMVQGKVSEGMKAATGEGKLVQSQNHFDWNISLGKKGTEKTYLMSYSDGENKHHASYKVYHSFPGEFVSRFTAFRPEEGSLWGLTEFSASYWFESLAGFGSYYWSQQRWGITGQTMLNLTSGLLRVTTADLKYRFTPGVWNREETFGLKVGYQNLNYKQVQGNMLGFGVFWLLTSTKFMDNTLNFVPLLRKPKVFDIQGMYYPLLIGSRGTLTGNFDVRFNSKIFIKPDFFLELGMGAKQFGLIRLSSSFVNSTLGFFTGGIGWVL